LGCVFGLGGGGLWSVILWFVCCAVWFSMSILRGPSGFPDVCAVHPRVWPFHRHLRYNAIPSSEFSSGRRHYRHLYRRHHPSRCEPSIQCRTTPPKTVTLDRWNAALSSRNAIGFRFRRVTVSLLMNQTSARMNRPMRAPRPSYTQKATRAAKSGLATAEPSSTTCSVFAPASWYRYDGGWIDRIDPRRPGLSTATPTTPIPWPHDWHGWCSPSGSQDHAEFCLQELAQA